MSCKYTTDCYTYDSDRNITSALCDDPNYSCICLDGKCTSTTCTGSCSDGLECVDTGQGYSSCTNMACGTDSSNCGPGMQCVNGICRSKKCADDGSCPKGSSCYNGYCITDTKNSLTTFQIALVVIVFVILAVVVVLYGIFLVAKYKNKSKGYLN